MKKNNIIRIILTLTLATSIALGMAGTHYGCGEVLAAANTEPQNTVTLASEAANRKDYLLAHSTVQLTAEEGGGTLPQAARLSDGSIIQYYTCAGGHFLIDVDQYKAMYPDLAAAFGNHNGNAYVEHYSTYGYKEGRKAYNADLYQQWVAEQEAAAEDEAIRLGNEERAKVGLPPLTKDATLMAYAKIRAKEQLITFGHIRPDGTKPVYCENLTGNTYSAKEAISNWMHSQGHRDLLMNINAAKVGIGFVSDRGTWIQEIDSAS